MVKVKTWGRVKYMCSLKKKKKRSKEMMRTRRLGVEREISEGLRWM